MAQQIDAVLRLRDQFSDAIKRAQNATKNYGKEWERQARTVRNASKSFQKASKSVQMFSFGAAGALVGAVKMSSDFETALAKVSTIADTSKVSMADLRKQIIEMSNDTGIAAAQVAESTYNAISAGQDTANAVQFVGQSAKLSVAGFADEAAALDILTTTLNSYSLASDQAGRVSDIMIQIQNKGKTTVGELSATMGKVIPTANAVGVNLEQLGASYAIMTANGIATAETTTYMNSMLNEFAKSGTKVDKVLRETAGKSFQELTAEGKSLGDILAIIKKAADDSGKSMIDYFGSAEAGKAALVLLKDGAEGFNASLADMKNSTGMTEEAFEKMLTSSAKIRKAINLLKNQIIEIGAMAAPYIELAATSLENLVKNFKSLNPQTKKVIFYLMVLVAVLAPVLSGIAKLLIVCSQLIPIFAAIKTTLMAGTVAFGAMTAPVWAVVAAVVGLIAVGVALYKNWDVVKKVGAAAWKFLCDVIGGAVKAIKDRFKGLVNFVAGVFTGDWQRALEGVRQIFASKFEWILGMTKSVKDALTSVKDALSSIGSDKPTNAGVNAANAGYMLRRKAIPHHAKGTNFFQGGLTYVNERAKGELIGLERGATIVPHDKSLDRAFKAGTRVGSGNDQYHVSFEGSVFYVREHADVEKIGEAVVRKLKLSRLNRAKGVRA